MISTALRIKEDRTLVTISLLVLLGHIIFSFFITSHREPVKKPEKKTLVVKTVQLQERTTVSSAAAPTMKEATVAQPIKKNETPAKKEVPVKAKTPVKKESVLKKEPPVKKETVPKKEKRDPPSDKLQNALTRAKLSLEKIEKNKDNGMVAAVKNPMLVGDLSADGFSESRSESDYFDDLCFQLKRSLKLPEYGSVAIMLTLSSQGEVLLLKIEQSKSALNQAYVERELPRIKFSPFSGSLAKQQKHAFPIALTNNE